MTLLQELDEEEILDFNREYFYAVIACINNQLIAPLLSGQENIGNQSIDHKDCRMCQKDIDRTLGLYQ